MVQRIGICEEGKSLWEKRTPLIPSSIKNLVQEGFQVQLEPSDHRCYTNENYQESGAEISPEMDKCDFLLGIKEMPIDFIKSGKPHLFFSHTIKGQSYNMPLLQKILDEKATLLDYERIVSSQEERLIGFGKFAGLAGAIDTLAILGKRLAHENIPNPFERLNFSHEYYDLEAVHQAIAEIGEEISEKGLPLNCPPLVFGVTGKGTVAKGVEEIFRWLPLEVCSPNDLPLPSVSKNKLIYTSFSTEDLYTPKISTASFDREEYRSAPEKYQGKLHEYLPHLTVLLHCIYWDERYPSLINNQQLQELFAQEATPQFRLIGDITCDISGSIECTSQATDQENPTFIFNPRTGKSQNGWQGEGIVVCAVDNLPAELPRDASFHFSKILEGIILEMKSVDFQGSFEQEIPEHIRKSIIVWQGKLTPDYTYLKEFLE